MLQPISAFVRPSLPYKCPHLTISTPANPNSGFQVNNFGQGRAKDTNTGVQVRHREQGGANKTFMAGV